MGKILLLEILRGCPKPQRNTLLTLKNLDPEKSGL